MGFIRKFIRNLVPSRNYQSFETEKIKTSKFTVIRRKRRKSSFSEVLRSISFFIAALCIFEAAVWFSTGFPEPENNKLRISYLETRISLHQPANIENPYQIIQSALDQLSHCLLFLLLLISQQFIFDQNKYFTDKDIKDTDKHNYKKVNTIEQQRTDWIVLKFLTQLASFKKSDRWIQ